MHSEQNIKYFLPKIEIEDNKFMIDGQEFFDEPAKNDMKTYENVRKVIIGQGDDYTSGCLLDYPYFKENYKLIALDLTKQQEVDADPKAIPQIKKRFSLLKKQKKSL